MSDSCHRLYVRAKHVSFQRGKRRSNPNISLLKLEGVDTTEAAKYDDSIQVILKHKLTDLSFYLGKKVVYIYRAKKEVRGSKIRCIWGKIRRTHGNNGSVRAAFRSNLPPKTLGATLRVMLYPSSI